MKWTCWLGLGLSAFLGSAKAAEEPKALYTTTVVSADAEVRSGPAATPQMYATNRLLKGDRVEVVREMEGGWLAIKPPPGSFSWINARFVKQTVPGRPMYVVVADPESRVPLLYGSQIKTDKPTVEGARVVRGTILESIGPMRQSSDGYWLPVKPPPTEMRYIRAEALARKPMDISASAAPAAPPGLPTGNPPAPGPGAAWTPGTPPAAPTDGPNPLWVRAQKAEQDGQYNEAIQLYRQLGVEVANSNHSLSIQAYNRAQWLADTMQGKPGYGSATSTSRASPQPPAPPAGTVSSGPGWLHRAGRSVDLNMMYVLENSQGKPLVYAVPQPGYTLAPYENRSVELYGVQQYRADLRAYYMTVVQVRPLQ
jgi:hypothetical protein